MTIRERFKRFKGRAKEVFRSGGSPLRSTSSLPNAQTHLAPGLPQTHSHPSSPPSGAQASPSHIGPTSPASAPTPGLLTVPSVGPSASAPNLIPKTHTPSQVVESPPNTLVTPPESEHVPRPSEIGSHNQTRPLATASGVQTSLTSADLTPYSPGENKTQQASLQSGITVTPPAIRDTVELLDTSAKNEPGTVSSAQDLQPATPINATPPTSAQPAAPVSAQTKTSSTSASSTWKSFSSFRKVVSGISGNLGPLGSVMAEFGGFVDMYEGEEQARQDYAALKEELERLFDELKTHFSSKAPPAMTAGMKNLCAAIENELDRISSKEERSLGRRYLEANRDLDEVMQCYRHIQSHLERLKLNVDLSTWVIVDEMASEKRLESLKASMQACYNSKEAFRVGRRECTPETRKEVIKNLDHWRHDKTQDNLYWLNGMAGTGKTTIASTLCAMLDQSHELGASFFCTRLLPECRDATLILPTIAYQLARFSRPFYHALSLALQADPDLHTKALPIQLRDLIIGPLREASRSLPDNLVVVIDALDECEDSQAVGLLLESLARQAPNLPLKLFVSSRPEPQIRAKIGNTGAKLILHELEKSIVKEDIRLYLQTELRDLSTSIDDRDLVAQWNAQACFSSMPQQSFGTSKRAGSSKASNAIDTLYNAILSSAFNSSNLDDEEEGRMRLVLDTVVCAQEPLTIKALAGLLRLEDVALIQDALDPLLSVVHISGSNQVVATLHASFPDYMLDPSRSKQHGCHADRHHGRIAELCFDRIDSNEKQFNICDLESSYVFDERVPDLAERAERAIPQDLSYACQYWAVHLELGGRSAKRLQRTCEFVSNRLLLWIEVLNLKKQMSVGASMFEKAKMWCRKGNANEETNALVHDAWRFVLMFASNDVSRSTVHLYVSMLSCWPSSEPLARYYTRKGNGLTRVGGTGMKRRQFALLSVLNAGGAVRSVVLSPDGTRIASGSEDGIVCVWDAQTGSLAFDPLKGHTSSVHSVAFSPDGMRIVSGSRDNTIRVWDAQTGQPVLGPLEGHTNSVRSVAFSPDGKRIISGSYDDTIRVWDSQNGQQVLEPLEGHTSSVISVGFSPDGMRIVSGSEDNTIRVWDAQTGQAVLGPLEGHTKWIGSVGFSPDGMRIVSGSHDKTIRVWDAQTGQPVLGPLEGYTSSVWSVAFSPDGMRIVSGSSDNKIRVWDAQAGRPVFEPLEGHTSSVHSVAFSPDGMRIISGSPDNTIRIWDAQTSQLVLEPLEGHSSSVNSVAFSPDGMRIVSGSSDNTIRVWDVQTGQPVLGPLEGHTSWVWSVAFSPDGMRIVSGSDDNTIRVWDAQTGQQVLEPLEGHIGSVHSVAFSLDSMRIVSGSDDNTIRVWDAQTGQPVLEPLEGHATSVHSVAFSPDGMRIVSGSHDGTTRVWDAQTGQLVLEPLEGHTSSVWSVAFSPDGMRIVSGSSDNTIRVWRAQTGQPVLGPLGGNTSSVRSVGFSPNGMRIVSGSSDSTIRIWDAHIGQLVLEPLEGHTSLVTSVAFSPDGMRIVSGSYDDTIRVWDAQNGQPASEPLDRNQNSVSPAAFLPDGAFVISSVSDNTNRRRDIGRSSDEASLTLQLPSARFHSWKLNPLGWVIDTDGRPLLWLPPDLRDRLMRPNTVLLISTQGFIELDFLPAKLGESWLDCFTPSPRMSH